MAGRRDPRLEPYVNAVDRAAADRALETLLREHADPVAADVIARRLRDPLERQDADDVRHDVHVQLVARLLDPHAGDDIADFAGYVAVVAHRACDAHLRRKFPNRARLKSRVRYVLKHHPALAIRESASGLLCGIRGRLDDNGAAGRTRLQELLRAGSLPRRGPLPELVHAVLAAANASVEIDALVSALAELLGVADEPAAPPARTVDDNWLERVPDSGGSPADRAEARDYLRRLWTEIAALPPSQRVALLLNLRDDRGHGVIALLAFTETATRDDLAAVLGMSRDDLAALWDDLPIDDARIAVRLGLTRQQVINLRKSARLRLARRMRRIEARH